MKDKNVYMLVFLNSYLSANKYSSQKKSLEQVQCFDPEVEADLGLL